MLCSRTTGSGSQHCPIGPAPAGFDLSCYAGLLAGTCQVKRRVTRVRLLSTTKPRSDGAFLYMAQVCHEDLREGPLESATSATKNLKNASFDVDPEQTGRFATASYVFDL